MGNAELPLAEGYLASEISASLSSFSNSICRDTNSSTIAAIAAGFSRCLEKPRSGEGNRQRCADHGPLKPGSHCPTAPINGEPDVPGLNFRFRWARVKREETWPACNGNSGVCLCLRAASFSNRWGGGFPQLSSRSGWLPSGIFLLMWLGCFILYFLPAS